MAKPMQARKTTKSTEKKPTPGTAKSKGNAPASSGGLRPRRLDIEALRGAFADTRGGGGGPKVPYMKFKVGENRIRILGPVGEMVAPFVHFRAHNLRPMGQKYGRNMLSYDWLMQDKNQALLEKLREAGKVKDTDIELFQQFGDAPTEVAAKAKDREIKSSKSLWPMDKYLFNVLNRADGKVYVFEAGRKFITEFLEPTLVGVYDESGKQITEPVEPDLLDEDSGYDVVVTATGDGLSRRYTYRVDRKPSPANLDSDTQLHDLFAIVARYATPYPTKVAALFAQERDVLSALQLRPEHFGVTGSVGAAAEDTEDDDPLGGALDG